MGTRIPTPIEKRNMLYDPEGRRRGDFLALGDALLEQGRECEALDFYERVPDEAARAERIGRVKKTAIERGDAFILNRIAGRASVTKDEWLAAARAARTAGRLRYALKAFVAAGEEAEAATLRAELGIQDPAREDAARPEDAKVGVKTGAGPVVAAIGAPPKPAEPPGPT